MRVLLYTILLLCALPATSQRVVDVGKDDVTFSPANFSSMGEILVSAVKYVKVVDGSPYFKDTWMRGTVIMSKGTKYDSVLLRLDLLDNSLQFINPRGEKMIATTPVRTIILSDSIKGTKYEFDHSDHIKATNQPERGWYQVLADGQAALYKKTVKLINENKPYGSATVEQRIVEQQHYFIFVNSVMTRVKKLKDIAELLQDKKDDLLNFIKSKNLNEKSETGFVSVVNYYNSGITK